ncbi:MAG: hypothetical protein FWD82_01150 [Defluviitaleaceae bacterium]|nr:hypothetical protein [Defluviitaleaceae bacterium]
MKSLIFDKGKLSDLHGLSCIENFLLYILREEQYAYKDLFYKSFLHFDEIIDIFFEKKVEYASFYNIKRIQDVAKENNIINVNVNSCLEPLFLDKHDYICVMVKPEYIKEKYKTELWREDHYILLSKAENSNFYYLNDTPRDTGLLSFDELKNIFSEYVIAFDINKNTSNEMKKVFLNEFIKDLGTERNDLIIPNISEFIMARDILGIHRVLRKRTYEFCSQYVNVDFLTPYLNSLDKYYALFEYMRLRDKVDYKKINEIFDLINKEDINQVSLMITELEKIK